MKKIFVLFCFFFFISFVDASSKFSVKLDKCIDGDTARFFISGESKTVRFLSINAPEIAHGNDNGEFYGDEASLYVCKVLTKAKGIKLQYDPKSDEVDKYGRVLAWIFVDGDLLQEDLVKKGYAEVKYVYDDYLYSSQLKDFEATAKEKNLGMWSNDISETISNNVLSVISNFKSFDFSKTDVVIYSIIILFIVLVFLFGGKSIRRKIVKRLSKFK